ncbi:hypothetical protein V565_022430 [Rhizoctonia solani 123E]|uniref:Transmembrane protein n=1 Tax=Rhizoctonia solani 123E TaxID=1423351 RepID=A0A074S900_9AGAM|nr:hypothetical protein V565_022430 [Rhizoctonia solani 123E]
MQVKALIALVTFYGLAAATPVVRAPPPDSDSLPEQLPGSLLPPRPRPTPYPPPLPDVVVERAVPTVQPPLQFLPKPIFPPAPSSPGPVEDNPPLNHLPPPPIPPWGPLPPIPTLGQAPPLPHSFGAPVPTPFLPPNVPAFLPPIPPYSRLPVPNTIIHATLPEYRLPASSAASGPPIGPR